MEEVYCTSLLDIASDDHHCCFTGHFVACHSAPLYFCSRRQTPMGMVDVILDGPLSSLDSAFYRMKSCRPPLLLHGVGKGGRFRFRLSLSFCDFLAAPLNSCAIPDFALHSA